MDGNVMSMREVPQPVPANLEAEQALLGAILVNNAAWHRVSDFLKAEHFSDKTYADLFAVMSEMIRAGRQVTGHTIAANDAEMREHIVDLARAAVTVINAREYGVTIHDAWVRRQLIETGKSLIADAHEETVERDKDQRIVRLIGADEIATRAVSKLMAIKMPEHGSVPTISSVLDELDEEDALIAGGQLPVVRTGIEGLDEVIQGLPRGEITISAGTPGMGKTALACSIAINAARAGVPVVKFSLEMPKKQIVRRYYAALSGVPYDRQVSGKYELGDREALAKAREELAALPLIIEDGAKMTARQIEAKAMGYHRRGRCGLIVIDYLGYIGDEPGTERMREDERIGQRTYTLKMLAKSLDVPVLLLCQLNREVMKRDPPIPIKSDLRGSGNIEQDAALIIMLFRAEEHLKRQKPEPDAGDEAHANWHGAMHKARGKALYCIEKNRFGPDGDRIAGTFDGVRQLFGG